MNLTPREDFLVSAFQDDPRLVEMFRDSERNRPPLHKFLWRMFVEEAVWWSKAGIVVGLTALAAYACGWGLHKMFPVR